MKKKKLIRKKISVETLLEELPKRIEKARETARRPDISAATRRALEMTACEFNEAQELLNLKPTEKTGIGEISRNFRSKMETVFYAIERVEQSIESDKKAADKIRMENVEFLRQFIKLLEIAKQEAVFPEKTQAKRVQELLSEAEMKCKEVQDRANVNVVNWTTIFHLYNTACSFLPDSKFKQKSVVSSADAEIPISPI